ncbi:hypothetical protein [Comamonas odontotermitis]|uniref:hypothetical protein n=1 Tax=Comamonas odontotermitis TaxID=379895 RepID=UPI003750619A
MTITVSQPGTLSTKRGKSQGLGSSLRSGYASRDTQDATLFNSTEKSKYVLQCAGTLKASIVNVHAWAKTMAPGTPVAVGMKSMKHWPYPGVFKNMLAAWSGANETRT